MTRFCSRALHIAQVTGHTLAGENAARVLTVTDRTRGTGRHGVTVGRAVGREVVTLDTTLAKPLPMVVPVTSTF